MNLSAEAKLVSGITLLAITTIMFGGWVLMGILTLGAIGIDHGDLALNETQRALWRAGHAHAGVWAILALIIQVLLDSTKLSSALKWCARFSAPLAAVAVSGGFFGVAFFPEFRWLMYFGILCLLVTLGLTGVGLLANLRSPEERTQQTVPADGLASRGRG
jgi:hypothetical protein